MARTADTEVVIGQQIAEALRASILRGDLRPGDRIRQEELAAEHGASRVPVREALRILETRGLVTLAANRGAWITRRSLAECVELYQVRARLEPLLLEDSVPRITEATIDEIAAVLAELDNVGTLSTTDYLELDARFHLLTYSASTMDSVRASVERLLEMTQFYRRAYHDLVYRSGDRNWILEYDHHLILDAIRRRDGFEASVVMGLHTRRAYLALEEHPELFEMN